MNRFFGLMPHDEVAIEKHFKDNEGGSLIVQAGPHGWTIIYPDRSSEYEDSDRTPEENFNIACDVLKKHGYIIKGDQNV